MNNEKAFICNLVLKPEAGKSSHDEMAEWLAIHVLVPGTRIDNLYKMSIPVNFWEKWYQHHADKPFFTELTGYMGGNDVVIIPIEAYDSKTFFQLLKNVKDVIGHSASKPGPFRKKFAVNKTLNAIHRPDCCESAHVEEEKLRVFKTPKNKMNFKFIEVRHIGRQAISATKN